MQPLISVIIADDHPIFCLGVACTLKAFPEINLLGIAKNGNELVEMVRDKEPDVVVTDIRMLPMDGREATIIIRRISPRTRVVVLSRLLNETTIRNMLDAGAIGYVCKNAAETEIVYAIKTVCNNHLYLCEEATALLKTSLSWNDKKRCFGRSKDKLTEKEATVAILLTQGLIEKQIADRMHICDRTVQTYKKRIMKKLKTTTTFGIIKEYVTIQLLTSSFLAWMITSLLDDGIFNYEF